MKWWKVSKSSLVWFIEERDRHDNKNVPLPARRSYSVSLASLLADNKSSCGESRDGMGLGKFAMIPYVPHQLEGFIYARAQRQNAHSILSFFNAIFLFHIKISTFYSPQKYYDKKKSKKQKDNQSDGFEHNWSYIILITSWLVV